MKRIALSLALCGLVSAWAFYPAQPTPAAEIAPHSATQRVVLVSLKPDCSDETPEQRLACVGCERTGGEWDHRNNECSY